LSPVNCAVAILGNAMVYQPARTRRNDAMR
jgi:hypothetical protein